MTKPFVKPLKDGTYQVKVPIPNHPLPHVAKDGFVSEDSAQDWIESEEGKAIAEKIIAKYCLPK
jgi:hypothetical protein